MTNIVHNHVSYLDHSEVIDSHYDLKLSYDMLHQQRKKSTYSAYNLNHIINNTNNNGPGIEPCGTQDKTSN